MASTYDNLITGRIWMFSCKIEETPDWSNIVLQEEAEFNQRQAAVAFILLTEKLIEGKRREEERRVIPMASNAAAPFWRAAGMTYITYSNICANLVRNCLKEPYKTEALSREKVHFAVTKFVDGNPQKPIVRSDSGTA
ncbi:ATP SYNTHASE EPSILON CHAIN MITOCHONDRIAL [Salix koriyanagi]|uniref:ATP synthase subunit epsilon, mitochondrial n=3 Tax=Salix TaxID=40685 RepID=A0A9Q0WJC2_9ROSI|nr:ATP SYNTHASE EPSILON CHAIN MITOCHONDRIAL [Salix koriyanagi]